MEALCGSGRRLRLELLTSEWAMAAAELVREHVERLLERVEGGERLVERLERRRSGGNGEDAEVGGEAWAVEAIDADRFRERCKQLGVTELPALVLVDDQDQAVTHAEAVHEALGSEAEELEGVIQHMLPLIEASQAAASDVAWWSALGATDSVKTTTDPAIIKMRDEAGELFESGELLAAAARFMKVLALSPRCTKSSFNLAVILHMLGETFFATTFMLRVVMIDDSDSVAHTVLRSVYYPDEPQRVLDGYRAIIATSAADHVRAVHSLATLEGEAVTAAPEYVREVFDELADTFEEKLVTHLEYRVPWQLVEALKRLEPAVFASPAASNWVVADVGCGTGLCGRLLRPHAKRIIGVDISPLMIEKTRASGDYDDLHTADIAPFLASCADGSLDLVISADVWIYVGALEEVFALCARKVNPTSGLMAFSIELLESETDPVFRLAPSGRFQHSHEYIATLASTNGFNVALSEDIHVRKESGQPIPGRIYVLQKALE